MRRNLVKAGVIVALAATPAIALAAGKTYKGDGDSDNTAKIQIKVEKKDGKRAVTKVVLDNLPYSGGLCSGSGRTPKATYTGSRKVKPNGEFRVARGGETANPLDSGEVAVKGKIKGSKITGTMKFTYGKTGCESDKLNFTATD